LSVASRPPALARSAPLSSPAPIVVTAEAYRWTPEFDPSWPCLSEDDRLDWAASGSLAVGESFTFTPRYPDCANSRAIVVTVGWDASAGAAIEVTAVVPGAPRPQSAIRPGVLLSGTPLRTGAARLCMFPYFTPSEWERVSVTVRNVGVASADSVAVSGYDANDWELFYYDACQRVDADGDGWSDSIEHGMENLSANEDEWALMGSDYLRGVGDTVSDDEFDFVPPDFDDDGLITLADVARISARLGAGTGVPVSSITPNPGANTFYAQRGAWRRFDLDGDGWITTGDVELVGSLVGSSGRSPSAVPPTVRITGPSGPVARGSWAYITVFASAPAGITKVDFRVGGTLLQVDSEAPFAVWWHVPKRAGASYEIGVVAYDAAGGSSSASNIVSSR
jgi:hypothetical protein